jgi:hypothetical protein
MRDGSPQLLPTGCGKALVPLPTGQRSRNRSFSLAADIVPLRRLVMVHVVTGFGLRQTSAFFADLLQLTRLLAHLT